MRIVSYGGSYIGKRSNNEDSIGRTIPHDPEVLLDKGRLYLVCDGMGGTHGGEVASELAVETIIESYFAAGGDPAECLKHAICEASRKIAARAAETAALAEMGSTVVALVVLADRYVHAHVGDSRAYLLRENSLRRLTRDHLHILDTLGVDEADAHNHPQKNILSRALGYLQASEPECGSLTCREGDRLLLCSDGLTDSLDEKELSSALEQSTPEAAVELLLRAAEKHGAHDNSTALAVFVSKDEELEGPTERIFLHAPDMLSSPARDAVSRIPVEAPTLRESRPMFAERT